MSCLACGTPLRSTCLCSQLSSAPKPSRSRTVWVGSVLPSHSAAFLSTELFPAMPVEPGGVTIRRNAWKGKGYALLVFERREDAEAAIEQGHPDFTVRAHQWQGGGGGEGALGVTLGASVHPPLPPPSLPPPLPGMPPLLAQLSPLPESSLRSRLLLLCAAPSPYTDWPSAERAAHLRGGRLAKKRLLAGALAAAYARGARRDVVRGEGRPMPKAAAAGLRAALMDTFSELEGARGGNKQKKTGRKGVSADGYLVLGRRAGDAPWRVELRHEPLWDACMGALRSVGVEPGERGERAGGGGGWACTSVAVTKNFRGSPHVDKRDSSYQYCACLGDFEGGGGELCVEEGGAGEEVHVVDTRGRVAKVDGRAVHWVRDWGGAGDRYSVVWFCVDEARGTQFERAVFRDWCGGEAPVVTR
ncbi:hypothetical protein TeGR_g12984 [Tetraparma gracilis]|uniref:tRNA-uridine aminocarboxypropyltransferase n=1 Tax=Tetraparma gracilis TaxID=2962635 RepID=A0ABQ6N9S9_9STRA|nr:hypothetical protein TeGR_g12984 [Tetraparma gracilis]